MNRSVAFPLAGLMAVGLLTAGCSLIRDLWGGETGWHDKAAEVKPADGKSQTMCPVLGAPIDRRYYVDYQGKRIYFATSVGPKRFLANPGRYLKEMEDQGVVLEDAPQPEAPEPEPTEPEAPPTEMTAPQTEAPGATTPPAETPEPATPQPAVSQPDAPPAPQ